MRKILILISAGLVLVVVAFGYTYYLVEKTAFKFKLGPGPGIGEPTGGNDIQPHLPPLPPGINELRDRQAALEQLPKGKIVLDAPKAMKVGEVREVHANVGVNVPIEVLQRYSRTTTQSTEGVLRVSSEMMAVLTGPGFKITATKPEQQGVAEGFPTVWSWDIEARQEGEQELEATLYVLLPSAEKSSRQRIDSYTHKIGVSVKEQTWGEWLKSRKEEIDAVKALTITGVGAITAVLGWLGWSYGSRKKNEELT